MIDQTSELSPTIKALDTIRGIENLSGSPLVKRKNLFGKEFSFYDDGSVLVVDPSQQEYHFLTREGRQKGSELRGFADEIIINDQRLRQMKMLGEGKGGFSKVYELVTPCGVVAVKAVSPEGFKKTELSERICRVLKDIQPEINLGGVSNRIVIQKMSLVDTMRFFKKLDEAGIRKPEFYGFTVRRNPGNNEIQEFQFMEKIDRPTVQSIFDTAANARDEVSGGYDVSKLSYPALLREIAIKYFEGDTRNMLRAIKSSFDDFVRGVKDAVPNIGDVEMDNIFLVGYDETAQQLEFMLIDPIEEQVFIRPIRGAKADLINNQIQFNKPENSNFPNKIKW